MLDGEFDPKEWERMMKELEQNILRKKEERKNSQA